MAIPRVLVIAGSDSSGGAGLEADQKVLAVHSCYAMTATTALTAQNTTGVEEVFITPAAFVAKQINACLNDIKADAVKLGMLASSETVDIVADTLIAQNISTIVLDPVMVSTSGAQLLPHDAVRVLRKRLLPLTTILTPNIPEATLLLRDAGIHQKETQSLEDAKALAKLVHKLGPKSVLLKGGHIPLTRGYERPRGGKEPSIVVDILYDGKDFTLIQSKYLDSRNTHGTGCSLASAIAANLASGQPTIPAVRNACRYVEAGIRLGQNIGSGHGPINHFHSLQRLPFAPGRFIEYLLERQDMKSIWQNYTNHEFVQGMGNGTLPRGIFKNYLIQDYLYLTHFARANALAAYKSKSMSAITASAQIVLHIDRESQLHLDYCEQFGLSRADIENHKESLACVAYGRYVLDVGQSGDWLALQMALAPCLIGYGVAAKRIRADMNTKKEGNPYWKWIENYTADDYQEAVTKGSELIENAMVKQSPNRIEELIKIFIRATELEIKFWELGAHENV